MRVCVNTHQIRPFSRKYDEKNIFMLSSGSFRKLSSRLTSSWSPDDSASSSSMSLSSDRASASASAGTVSLTGPGTCCSKPIYIRYCKLELEGKAHVLQQRPAHDIPHMLHAMLSRWPSPTIFKINARLTETINRRFVPIQQVNTKRKTQSWAKRKKKRTSYKRSS